MGVDFLGAGVGAIFSELLKAVLYEIKKAKNFSSIFKRLESTLNRIRPVVVDIEELDRRLDRSDDEITAFTRQLQQGLDLVRKCAKVRRLDGLRKNRYAKKLEAFERSLLQWAQIDVQLHLRRDSSKLLAMLDINRKGAMGGVCDDGNEFVGGCEVPGAPDFLVGLDEPLRELKAKLLDGGGEQVVVISAPGGCGKTTLVKKLCSDEAEGIKGIFKDNIFFVTLSKTPNVMVIVRELFQHKGYRVREFRTNEDAINQLELMLKRLEGDHILLVLDDVWPESEFPIETLEFDIPGYKILVTSRSKIDGFFNYELKLLDDHDAMALFRHHSALPQDGSSCIPYDLVKRTVRGCGGFPLALSVVGRSLRGKPVPVWNHRLTQWSEGQSIVYSNNQLLLCLQTSIDALNEMDKEYYMDLAAFPEDQRITVAALIDMWAELYNLNEDGEGAFVKLYEFSCQNLVKFILPRKDESEINGYYNEHSVTQHDLLRDIALYRNEQSPNRLIVHIRGNNLSRIEQMQDTVHACFVSISTDNMFSGNWCNMQLPAVEVLVLNLQTRNYLLPHSVEQMDRLKALIITNYGFCSAEISNFPLVGQLSSLKRIRLERISISCITNSILQLKNLRKLSLVMCKIDEAFQECTIHIPNLMPNLVEIAVDYCNDLVKFPEWLCCVNSIQKLSITNCHEFISLPEGLGNLGNLKVLRLQSCTKLSELPESVGGLHKLGFLDISDCISISKLPERMGELRDLRKLNMRGCCGLCELPYSVKDLKQLENLICDDETAGLWEHYETHLTNLRLKVINEDANLDWLHGFHP